MLALSSIACLATCGFVWKLFDALEQTEVLKPHVAKRVADLIEEPASILSILTKIPPFFLSAFDAVFTDKLFSLRGFFRSAIISAFVVSILSALWLYTKPSNIPLWIGPAPRANFYPGYPCPLHCYALNAAVPNLVGNGQTWVTAHYLFPHLLTPFFYNFVFDWIALIATRRYL